MKELVKNEYELVRGRKYTKLLLKGTPFQQWENETLSRILKTNDFEKQVEWFRNNLRG